MFLDDDFQSFGFGCVNVESAMFLVGFSREMAVRKKRIGGRSRTEAGRKVLKAVKTLMSRFGFVREGSEYTSFGSFLAKVFMNCCYFMNECPGVNDTSSQNLCLGAVKSPTARLVSELSFQCQRP